MGRSGRQERKGRRVEGSVMSRRLWHWEKNVMSNPAPTFELATVVEIQSLLTRANGELCFLSSWPSRASTADDLVVTLWLDATR